MTCGTWQNQRENLLSEDWMLQVPQSDHFRFYDLILGSTTFSDWRWRNFWRNFMNPFWVHSVSIRFDCEVPWGRCSSGTGQHLWLGVDLSNCWHNLPLPGDWVALIAVPSRDLVQVWWSPAMSGYTARSSADVRGDETNQRGSWMELATGFEVMGIIRWNMVEPRG